MKGPGGMFCVFKTTVMESVFKRFIFSGNSAVMQWQSVCTCAMKWSSSQLFSTTNTASI